jgi:conjugative relaxase-like TrwC/TraI family protein
MSAAGAKDYFEKDSYYTKNQEQGQWQGKVAEQMGLTGNVNQKDFETLLKGEDLEGNQVIRLTSKDIDENGDRVRAGVDFTFSAPKSVSVVYEMALAHGRNDLARRLVEGHEQSMSKVLGRMENDYAGVRVKNGKEVNTEAASGLIIAKFTHDTTRSTEGLIDPQLHTHAFVMNMTKDQDGNFKAVDYKNLIANEKFFGQEYRNEFAKFLKEEIGFDLVGNKDGLYDINLGSSAKELLSEFSQRSQLIESKMPEYREKYPGKSDSDIKRIVAKLERDSKKEINRDEVRADNLTRAENLGYGKEWFDSILQKAESNKANQALLTPEQKENKIQEINKTAAQILHESQSTFTKEDFLKTAGKLALANAITISSLESKMDKLLIKNADGKYTTQEMKDIEKAITKEAVKDKNNDRLSTVENAKEKIDKWSQERLDSGKFGLTPGQKEAAELLLSSKDRINLIQGDAGTGKTTMLKAANDIAQGAGVEIVGLAYTGKAANEINEASGIKSQTLHSFLNSTKESAQGQIWVVDEASMIGSKQLANLIDKSKEVDAKIMLMGDSKQFKSLAAGNMFDFLKDNGVVQTAKMEEVLRQKTDYMKASVSAMKDKDFEKAFGILEAAGSFREHATREDSYKALVDEYLSRDEKRQNETLIMTQKNSDREVLNNMIRDSKGLDGESFTVQKTASIRPSEAFFADSYSKVDTIFALGNLADGKIRQNETLSLVGRDEEKNFLTVQNSKGEQFEIDLKKDALSLSAYQKDEKKFAENDKILFTKNDKNLGVQNGVTGTIEKIEGDNFTVKIGKDGEEKTVNFNASEYNFIDHGFVVSEYAAQGQTSKETLSFMRAEDRMTTQNSAYVSLTRAEGYTLEKGENKEEFGTTIFTDSKEELLGQLENETLKTVSITGEDLQEIKNEKAEENLSPGLQEVKDLVDALKADFAKDEELENEKEQTAETEKEMLADTKEIKETVAELTAELEKDEEPEIEKEQTAETEKDEELENESHAQQQQEEEHNRENENEHSR